VYLTAIATFCNQEQTATLLVIARELGLSYKAALTLRKKLRAATVVEKPPP
jgi:hypothetical protein